MDAIRKMCRGQWYRFRLFAIVVLCASSVAPAQAFKPDTHVWVAQEVLNDVAPDGRVTINGREYPVSQQVWRALADNPSQYRMGSIGPDAFPDILAGQLAVHPGVAGAWQTDDWLKWLLSGASQGPEASAFGYGYLAHAAADIFSHSYVNTYTGGIFLFTNGDGEPAEQEVEVRHYALEGYIARFNPPLRDANGVDLGRPSGLVATPASYIRNHLIFNNTVQSQYETQPYTYHLAAMHGLYKAVGRARDKINEIDGIVIPEQLGRLLGRVTDLQRQGADLLNEIEQIQNDILVKTSLININNELIPIREQLIQAKLQEIEALNNAINSLQGLVAQRNSIVADLQNQLANTVRETCQSICRNTPPGCGRFPRPPCVPFCDQICELTAAWIDINNRLQQAILERDQTLADLNARLYQKTVAERAKQEAEIALAALRAENAALQAAIDTANTLLAQRQMARQQLLAEVLAVQDEIAQTNTIRAAHVYVIRGMLDKWHRDLERATDAYVVAWGDVIKEVMNGTGTSLQPLFGPDGRITNGVGDSALTPLSQWKDCWLPVYAGVPSEIPNSECAVSQGVDRLKQAIRDFRAALGPLNWLVDPAAQLESMVLAELEPAVVRATLELTDKLGLGQLTDTIRLAYYGATAATLNAVFGADSSRKRLLLIGDIASRVDAEMRLTAQGHFDPAQYRVARNAVTLAKLTLLDAATLNRVAADVVPGLTATVYGPVLYPEMSISPEAVNVLIGAVKSIDGNQQWQQLGLPYLRAGANQDPVWPRTGALGADNLRSFGYGFRDGTTGFRFWEDPNVREYAFRNQATALFKGPLAPGIEYPQEFGLASIVRADYPFRACPQNPFPRTTNIDGTFVTDASGQRRDAGCDSDLTVTLVPTLNRATLRVQVNVTNNGAARARASTVALYLSTDAARDVSDVLLGERRVAALGDGASVNFTMRATLPATLAAGNYYLIAVVDPAALVAEANETNNSTIVPLAVP